MIKLLLERIRGEPMLMLEFHLNVRLTPNDNFYLYHDPTLPKGHDEYREMTPIGRAIIDSIMSIDGTGCLWAGAHSFRIAIGLAYDKAEIVEEIIRIITRVVGMEPTISTLEGEYMHRPARGPITVLSAREAVYGLIGAPLTSR